MRNVIMPRCCKCGKEFPYEKMFCSLLQTRASIYCEKHKATLVCEKCADKTNMTATMVFMIHIPIGLSNDEKVLIENTFDKFFVSVIKKVVDNRIERF